MLHIFKVLTEHFLSDHQYFYFWSSTFALISWQRESLAIKMAYQHDMMVLCYTITGKGTRNSVPKFPVMLQQYYLTCSA